jgi:hypothetical protein
MISLPAPSIISTASPKSPFALRCLTTAATQKHTQADPIQLRHNRDSSPASSPKDTLGTYVVSSSWSNSKKVASADSASIDAKSIPARTHPTKLSLDSSASSMRNIAEAPWLQEEDSNDNEATEQIETKSELAFRRYDWRKPCFSRAKIRKTGIVSIDKPRNLKRFVPLGDAIVPGEKYFDAIQNYRSKWVF